MSDWCRENNTFTVLMQYKKHEINCVFRFPSQEYPLPLNAELLVKKCHFAQK